MADDLPKQSSLGKNHGKNLRLPCKSSQPGRYYSPLESLVIYTLPETNMAPENGWLEDEFPFGMPYLQGRTVSLSRDIGGAMER